jgi:hypothetical protein
MKYEAGAIYEQFIDGRMRIVGSGADKEWEEPQSEAEAWDALRNKVWNAKTGEEALQALNEANKDGALTRQEGGNHYKDMAIQPVEFITANNLGFLEGNVVKYICRHHAKNGAEDIKKAIHYCELLLQNKYGG